MFPFWCNKFLARHCCNLNTCIRKELFSLCFQHRHFLLTTQIHIKSSKTIERTKNLHNATQLQYQYAKTAYIYIIQTGNKQETAKEILRITPESIIASRGVFACTRWRRRSWEVIVVLFISEFDFFHVGALWFLRFSNKKTVYIRFFYQE